ncbi:MAG: efflux RND transporter permease subunit [Candidatus Rifleibacteriota bacterium]
MKLTELALTRPVAVTVLSIAIAVTGLFSLTLLDVNYLPNISYPMVKIHAWWRGATADDIETNVADPLEEVIATVDGLDYLESSSIEGMYTLLINFTYGVNVEVAFQDVVAAMGRVTKKLPKSMDPPIVIKADPSQLPVIEVMITSDKHDLVWLRDWAENWLVDRLATVEGSAGAEVVGGLEREIRIHLDPKRLQAYRISPAQVSKALYDENLETFAGRVTVESREIIARTMGEFNSVEEIENVVVTHGPSGEEVFIKDIARVEDSNAEMRISTHFNGKPCIEFKVLKQYAANAVLVANRVKEMLQELKKDIPEGIEFGFVEDESTYVMGAINSVRDSAVVSAILVILVVYLFLGRWRQVIVMILALPLTLVANFGLMKAAGFSINVFSLGGLVVALGVILDNSIVVLENITRLKAEGVKDYSSRGVSEVGSAIVASTLTFLAIFLPFVFVPGMSALLFKELVMVVAGVVLLSLFVAITFTPLLTDRLLRSEKEGKAGRLVQMFDWIIDTQIKFYTKFLNICLNNKISVILIAFAMFGAGLILAGRVGSEFLPKLDDGRVMVKLVTPSGTAVAEVEKILEKAEKELHGMSEIESIFRLAGGRVFGLYTLEVGNEGNLNIQLVPRSQRNLTTMQFVDKIRPIIGKIQKQTPAAKMPVKPMPIKGMRKVGEQDIEVNIKGSDPLAIYEFAEQLAAKMMKINGFSGVNLSMDMTKPEYQVKVDRAKASVVGLSVTRIAETLKNLVQGLVTTQFAVGSEYYPIRVMVPEISLKSKADLENLVIETKNGEPIFIKDVATVNRAVGPVEISREDQVMRVIVRADAVGISTGEGLALAEKAASELERPAGVSYSMGSEARLMAESKKVMTLIIGFALLFAYVILAIQFESFILPGLIIINIPLTLTGVFFALWLTGNAIGVTVQIGVLVMMGGVTSQGVVLLSLAEEYRQQGMSSFEAIQKAAPTRVRPILMTQLTTVLGLFPLALNMGEGGDMLVTMAIGVIGGLVYSLGLALVFLPAAYGLVYSLKARFEPAKAI